MLFELFRESQRDIDLRFDFLTKEKLQTVLTYGTPALHLSLHGHQDFVLLEDGESGVHWLKPRDVTELVRTFGGDRLPQLVFVSACHSSHTGQAFVDAGVQSVVCVKVNEELMDASANIFTRAFYCSLAVGKTVRHAFEAGKHAVMTSPLISRELGSTEGDKFVLLPEGDSHEEPVFDSPQIRTPWAPRRKPGLDPFTGGGLPSRIPDCSHLPRVPEDFEGREIDMHRVIVQVRSSRFVTLWGEPSVGKTAVAAAVAIYIHEHRLFQGVCFARLSACTTYERFLVILQKYLLILVQRAGSGAGTTAIFKDELVEGLQRVTLRGPGSLRQMTDDYYERLGSLPRRNSYDVPSRTGTEGSLGSLLDSETSVASDEDSGVTRLEDAIITFLSPLKLLLIFDHLDKLMSDAESAADVKIFIGRVLKYTDSKILATSSIPTKLTMPVVEHSIKLKPLTLLSSVRLFARLNKALVTAQDKADFVGALVPPDQANVTVLDRFSAVGGAILNRFGKGFPQTIINMACKRDEAGVRDLREGAEGDIYRLRRSGKSRARSPTPE